MDERERYRREVALQCLLVFLESPGAREDKVRAAVDYASLLVKGLDATQDDNP